MDDQEVDAKSQELQRAYSEAEAAALAIAESSGQAKHAACEAWVKKNAAVRKLGEELMRLRSN